MAEARVANLCLIGSGGIGARHVLAGREAGDVLRYGALYDTDPARIAAFQERTGLSDARVFTRWEDVLRDPEIDAVDLCLPNSLHAQYAIEAFSAGKHVLTEKPMALSIADCDRMIAAAEQAGRLLTVIHNRKFDTPAKAFKELVDGGALGDPFLIETHGIEGPNTVGKGRWLSHKNEGGIAMAQTVHFAYMVQWLLGPVSEVSCFTSQKGIDWMEGQVSCVIMLRFANEAIGEMTSTFAEDGGGHEHRITIYGPKGVASHAHGSLRVACPERYGDKDWHEVEFPGFSWGEGFAHQVRQFGAAVLGQGQVAVSPAEGRAAVELIEAAYRSAETRRAVRLPLS